MIAQHTKTQNNSITPKAVICEKNSKMSI